MSDKEQNNKSRFVSALIEKIRKGNVKMRPRYYFIFKTAIFVFAGFLAFLSLLFTASFVLFALRASGVLYLHGMGLRGFLVFVFSLPWFLLFLAVILLVILEIIAKRFSFVYRRPVIYSLVIIVAIFIAGTFLIDKTSMHPVLFGRAEEGELPVMGPLYRGYGSAQPEDAHRGVIVSEISDQGFDLQIKNGDIIKIIIDGDTRRFHRQEPQINDSVVVMGILKNGEVRAEGIRVIDDNLRPFMNGRGRRMPPPPPPGFF